MGSRIEFWREKNESTWFQLHTLYTHITSPITTIVQSHSANCKTVSQWNATLFLTQISSNECIQHISCMEHKWSMINSLGWSVFVRRSDNVKTVNASCKRFEVNATISSCYKRNERATVKLSEQSSQRTGYSIGSFSPAAFCSHFYI